jgi:hypothetical protein
MAILSKKDKNNNIFLGKIQIMKKTKHNLYSEEINVLKFPYAVWQSFLSISPILQVDQWPQAKRAAPYQAKC